MAGSLVIRDQLCLWPQELLLPGIVCLELLAGVDDTEDRLGISLCCLRHTCLVAMLKRRRQSPDFCLGLESKFKSRESPHLLKTGI